MPLITCPNEQSSSAMTTVAADLPGRSPERAETDSATVNSSSRTVLSRAESFVIGMLISTDVEPTGIVADTALLS